MIARLSKRMASFFVRNEVIKSEDEEVYEYGLQLLLSTVFNGIIAFVLAIISRTAWQCICYLAVFILIRQSAGGFHAKTHLGCCCILAVVLSLFIVFIKYVPINTYVAITVFAVAFSVAVILLFAPLEHENKPISDKDKKRLRKISITYAILISIIISFLFVSNMLEIMVCLALGIFTASISILVAVIEKKIKTIHLGT